YQRGGIQEPDFGDAGPEQSPREAARGAMENAGAADSDEFITEPEARGVAPDGELSADALDFDFSDINHALAFTSTVLILIFGSGKIIQIRLLDRARFV
ncbi:MAG: hypothetical protein LBD62_01630, partial [Candidatus Margulisbacteria bacterium]|nr:hypothetical protein [Candidatus Margulisiibacteriota bacterium]